MRKKSYFGPEERQWRINKNNNSTNGFSEQAGKIFFPRSPRFTLRNNSRFFISRIYNVQILCRREKIYTFDRVSLFASTLVWEFKVWLIYVLPTEEL